MAPSKKAAQTAQAVVANDPATFDVAGWLQELSALGFEPRNVTVKMHIRGDLIPKLNELIEKIQTDEELDREVGVNDKDPKAALIAEYEELQQEFEDGGSLDFVFRPMTKAIHNKTFRAWEAEHPGDKHSDDDFEELVLRRMVETCIDFPGKGVAGGKLTVEALQAFESAYGTPAFNTLAVGFNEAYNSGGEIAAPFSPKPSRTPDTAG
jgi:hypothetical protein